MSHATEQPSPSQQAKHATHTSTGAAAAAFRTAQLEGANTPDLPTDHPRPLGRTSRAWTHVFDIPATLAGHLEALARAKDAPLQAVYLAAFTALLHRYSQETTPVVGVWGLNRPPVASPGQVGPASELLPLQVRLSSAMAFDALVLETRNRIGTAAAVPFDAGAGLAGEDEASIAAARITFHFRQAIAPAGVGVTGEAVRLDRPAGPADLALELVQNPDGMAGRLELAADLFVEGKAEQIAGHLLSLLAEAVAAPQRAIGELGLLTPRERRLLLEEWNGTDRDFVDGGALVHDLFRQQALRTPTALAVRHDGRELTYAELDAASDALAAELQGRGLGNGSRIALLLQPSLDVVVAMYGILKAGAAYVPLDPDAPSERLSFILRDAGIAAVLTQRPLLERLPREPQLPRILVEEPRPAGIPDSRGQSAASLAYVIYTSGSTGEPKGVLVSHAAVVNHNLSVAGRFALRPDDRMLQFTPVFFDAAGEEIYPPLLSGASIVIRGELVPHAEFRDLVEREGLTILSLPPAYLHEVAADLVARGERLPGTLRLVILGGEKLLPETWALWKRLGGEGIPWINVYGPTEGTVTSSMQRIATGEQEFDVPSLPIGRPIDNVRLHLLDPWLQLMPPGVPGEIYIAGRGLADGYLNRPDLTAERFIPDPFGPPGARLYRTGDLARHLDSGALEFLGRVDHQVKLRGFRVELGEIEARLRQHPGVREVIVLLREETPGDKRLAAWVVAEPGTLLTAGALRSALEASLPEYMIPSDWGFPASLPLTANGKVDRKALPPPDTRAGASAADARGPASELEERLLHIWQEVLSNPAMGVDDDFFELGGHSLSAIQILSRLELELGILVELRDIFEHSTVAGLAAVAARAGGDAGGGGVPEVDVDQLSDEDVERMLREMSGAS